MGIHEKATNELKEELKNMLSKKKEELNENELEYLKKSKLKHTVEKVGMGISNSEGFRDKYEEYFNYKNIDDEIIQLQNKLRERLNDEIFFLEKTIEELS